MPREIVTVQIGQCGNQIGARFWDLALREHASQNQAAIFDEPLSSFFRNVDPRSEQELAIGDGRQPIASLRARAVLVDTEEGVVSQLLRSPLGEIWDKRQILTDVSGAGNNWAHGYEHYGPLHRESFLERVRRAVGECDSIQTFSLIHSMGGGTGSGLGTYALAALADEFPRVSRFVTAVFPSAHDDVITSPYNALLATHQLIEHADAVLPVENEALMGFVRRSAEAPQGRCGAITENSAAPMHGRRTGAPPPMRAFDAMNNVVAHALSALTASVRFAGVLNTDLSEIASNLVPFPRMHFLLPALAPLCTSRDLKYRSSRLEQLCAEALAPAAQLMQVDPRRCRYLACGMLMRGDLSVADAQRFVARARAQLELPYWNPDNFKVGLCAAPPVGQPHAVLALANNCAIADVLRALLDRFERPYRRRAHVHHFTRYTEAARFDEAREALEAVASSYEEIQHQQPPPEVAPLLARLAPYANRP